MTIPDVILGFILFAVLLYGYELRKRVDHLHDRLDKHTASDLAARGRLWDGIARAQQQTNDRDRDADDPAYEVLWQRKAELN